MWAAFARAFWFGWFLFVLLIPAGLYAAGVRARPIEERPMTALPEFGVSRILDPAFYSELDKPLSDRNPARKTAIMAYARVSYALFGEVSGAQIVSGRDGWIFLRQTLTGECVPQAQLDVQIANLEALGHALEVTGKQYVITVAPDKARSTPTS